MTPKPRPHRKYGGQPGNLNALKHGLYARFYSQDTCNTLQKWELKDLIGEVQLLRVSIEKVAGILLLSDEPVMEMVAMLNALSRSAVAIMTLVKSHFLLNTAEDPVYIAWDDITHEREFFTDGVPPE
jgi:hypothetical protein